MPLKKEEMIERLKEHIDNIDVLNADCDIIEFMLDNCTITIPDENKFFVNTDTEEITMHVKTIRAKKFEQEFANSRFADGEKTMAYTGLYDFGHTTTEWESVIPLGIFGLKRRVEEYAAKKPENIDFYARLIRVYNAALRFIKRAADEAASCGKATMAGGLYNLAQREPRTLFEALQTSRIYYTLQQMFDGTILRTLGRLDTILYPFYVKEKKENAYTMFCDYLSEFDRLEINSNIPFALGGTDIYGNSLVNELSYILLDAYANLHTANIKLHILCSDNTPNGILENAFECVRNGNNSIVFISDNKVIESLVKLGEDRKDAVNYHIVGCYECGGNGEITSSCNARVNIPKALELALNDGKDILTGQKTGLCTGTGFKSYEELYSAFLRQLEYLCTCAMKVTDMWESHYSEIHSAPIFSATYKSALENGRDIYAENGAKYNNSSVNALGLATAVDSLVAIKKLVFVDKEISLDEFTQILKNNWAGKEQLRLRIRNKFPKFGQNDSETDAVAKDIVYYLSKCISRKPNGRGGIYRLGLFSIDWRWEFGKKTAASADGRLSGETISQNTSATFGADRGGVTAHLMSVAGIDTSNTPNGAIVDIDLHSTAVKDDAGLKAQVAALRTYFKRGGFAVHYNVLDTGVLKDAKLNPESYPNLQIRLCGWNARFVSLSEKEQDEFIERSEQ